MSIETKVIRCVPSDNQSMVFVFLWNDEIIRHFVWKLLLIGNRKHGRTRCVGYCKKDISYAIEYEIERIRMDGKKTSGLGFTWKNKYIMKGSTECYVT